MRHFAALLALPMIAFTPGCGQNAGSPPAASTAGGAAPVAALPPAPENPIARVTYEFLDAVRRGDTARANGLLTPLALQRTTELDLNFSPPGSSTASFEIGQVELVEQDKAVVESRWADRDADGNLNQEQIIWALRLADGQWRISGMAAEIGADQPNVVIDFENPEAFIDAPAPAKSAAPEGVAGGVTPQDRAAQDPFKQPLQR